LFKIIYTPGFFQEKITEVIEYLEEMILPVKPANLLVCQGQRNTGTFHQGRPVFFAFNKFFHSPYRLYITFVL